MNLDTLTDDLRNGLQSFFHVEWLSTAITVALVVLATAILAHILTKLIQTFLLHGNTSLPASTIFVNIGRITVWSLGICVILSSCFNINVSSLITALGIGGLAISLGFQSTLSNLIGGLQLSLTRLIEPGDNIEVGNYKGIVRDMTWRHTSIETTRGESVIIPNSVINTAAFVKLQPETDIRIGVVVKPQEGQTLDELSQDIVNAVNETVSNMTVLEKKAKVHFYEYAESGYRGTLSFAIGEGVNVGTVKDAALKSISQYAGKIKNPQNSLEREHRHMVKVQRRKNASQSSVIKQVPTPSKLVKEHSEKREARKQERKQTSETSTPGVASGSKSALSSANTRHLNSTSGAASDSESTNKQTRHDRLNSTSGAASDSGYANKTSDAAVSRSADSASKESRASGK